MLINNLMVLSTVIWEKVRSYNILLEREQRKLNSRIFIDNNYNNNNLRYENKHVCFVHSTRKVSSMRCTGLQSIFSHSHCTGYCASSLQKEQTLCGKCPMLNHPPDVTHMMNAPRPSP